jgi:hypothetical protein
MVMNDTTSWLGLIVSVIILLFGNGLCYRRTKPNASALVSLVVALLSVGGLYYVWSTLYGNPASKVRVSAYREASGELPHTLPVALGPPKADPNVLDVTFQEFAATLASLSDKDRACYLESIASKRVSWTGRVREVHLLENYLYLADNPDPKSAANIAVQFPKDLRAQIVPIGASLHVTGTTEIRGPWVVVNASELTPGR